MKTITGQYPNGPRARILHALRRMGPSPRAILAPSVGISAATMSALTSAMIAEGVLLEHGGLTTGRSRERGRPTIDLHFNPSAATAIGVWVGYQTIQIEAVDYAAKMIARADVNVELASADAGQLITVISAAIQNFIAEHLPGRTVLAAGLAFQGLVDTRNGSLVWSPVIAAKDAALSIPLSRKLGMTVVVDNDACAMAFAESVKRPFMRDGLVAFLMLGDGLGLGLLSKGELLRGGHGGGSEFGHIQINPQGPICRCGARGCIEAGAADYALFHEARLITPTTAPVGQRPNEDEMQALVGRALQGSAQLKRLYESAGEILGRGAAILIQTLQPDRIIIGGPGVRARQLIEKRFMSTIETLSLSSLRKNLAVTFLDENPSRMTEGPALQALDTIDEKKAGQ